MDNFKDYLLDVIRHVEPFRGMVSHILVRKTAQDDVIAVAKEQNNNFVVMATALKPIDTFETVGLFGNLPFLKSVLDSAYMSGKFNITYNYSRTSNGATNALSSLMVETNKFKASYRATDPFIGNFAKINIPKVDNWMAAFPLDKSVYEDFRNAAKIHASAPKTGSDKDDIFELICNSGVVRASFGLTNNSTEIVLSESVAMEDDSVVLNDYYSISMIDPILKMAMDGKGVLSMSQNLIRIDLETDYASYVYTIYAKKLKN